MDWITITILCILHPSKKIQTRVWKLYVIFLQDSSHMWQSWINTKTKKALKFLCLHILQCRHLCNSINSHKNTLTIRLSRLSSLIKRLCFTSCPVFPPTLGKKQKGSYLARINHLFVVMPLLSYLSPYLLFYSSFHSCRQWTCHLEKIYEIKWVMFCLPVCVMLIDSP